jgi:hypothetical protein
VWLGAYLNLSAYIHPGCEKGVARSVASIKSVASIGRTSGTPGGFARTVSLREASGDFSDRAMLDSIEGKGPRERGPSTNLFGIFPLV